MVSAPVLGKDRAPEFRTVLGIQASGRAPAFRTGSGTGVSDRSVRVEYPAPAARLATIRHASATRSNG